MSTNGDDRYDPTGEAAIWQAAANLIASMKADDNPEGWNAALTQASRALENEARGIRQSVGGMYYRQISGTPASSLLPTDPHSWSSTKGIPLSHIWYAAYGSNLHARRLAYYLEGGTPPGTDHTYPGFRDRTPPLKTTPLTLPGTVYFAWQSPVWTGGVAFYADQPHNGWPRGAAARGYLLTRQQFSDLLTQEMYRIPGEVPEFDIDAVLEDGRVQFGEGRYETLVHVDNFDGFPILTFTSPWDTATVELRKPSARYLGMLAEGLRESHQWEDSQIFDYLSKLPGVQDFWETSELRALAATTAELP
ncbi:hypothetical protein [Nocardia sp. IFM 10818]